MSSFIEPKRTLILSIVTSTKLKSIRCARRSSRRTTSSWGGFGNAKGRFISCKKQSEYLPHYPLSPFPLPAAFSGLGTSFPGKQSMKLRKMAASDTKGNNPFEWYCVTRKRHESKSQKETLAGIDPSLNRPPNVLVLCSWQNAYEKNRKRLSEVKVLPPRSFRVL